MQESENQVVTAKADQRSDGEGTPPAVAAKKPKRVLWIVVAVLGACLVFGLGAIVGGGAALGLTRARSCESMRPSVRTWMLPREMPHQDFPMRPGRDLMGFQAGAMIVEVVPDSPAARAGLREGDILVALDGESLDGTGDLAAMIALHKPGDEVVVEVAEMGVRLGMESREVTVTLAEHPETAGKAYLGVTFVPSSGEMFGPGGRMSPFEHFEDGDKDGDDDRLHRFEFRWPRR